MPIPFLSIALLAIAAAGAVAGATSGRRLAGSGRAAWLGGLAGTVLASAVALIAGIPWQGQLHVTGYSLLMLLGFIAAYLVALPKTKALGIPERRMLDVLMLAVLGGFAGARIRYVWENWWLFSHNPDGSEVGWATALANAADFDSGGMVWYGGMMLASGAIMAYAWRTRLPILALGDALALSVILGLGIGRIGCFINGCCYGAPTDLPWGVAAPYSLPNGVVCHVHPTQLYESAACLAIFAGLSWLWPRHRWQGQVGSTACIAYGCWRFFNEGLRGDQHTVNSVNFLGLQRMTTSQATSLYLVLIGILVAVTCFRRWPVPGQPAGSAAANAAPPVQVPPAQTPRPPH